MLRRAACITALLLLPACSDGCSLAHVKPGTGIGPVPQTAVAKSKGVRNTYFRVRSTRDGGGGNFRPLADVYAPLRLECRVGDLSEKRRSWGDGYVNVSLSDPAFLGQAFFNFEVRRSGEGLSVTTQASPGGAELPATTFPDAPIVDLAFEHTGTEIVLLAKAPDDEGYTELRRHATAYTGPFRASFDALDLAKKGEVGLDDVIVVNDTDPPDLTTAQARAWRAGGQAIGSMLVAARAVDAGTDDSEGAIAALQAADGFLSTAESELSAAGGASKAAKDVQKLRKKLGGIVGKLERGKPASSSVKPLRSALQLAVRAMSRFPRP